MEVDVWLRGGVVEWVVGTSGWFGEGVCVGALRVYSRVREGECVTE